MGNYKKVLEFIDKEQLKKGDDENGLKNNAKKAEERGLEKDLWETLTFDFTNSRLFIYLMESKNKSIAVNGAFMTGFWAGYIMFNKKTITKKANKPTNKKV